MKHNLKISNYVFNSQMDVPFPQNNVIFDLVAENTKECLMRYPARAHNNNLVQTDTKHGFMFINVM